MNYFEVKVRYDKIGEDGTNKKEIETLLVEGLNFSESERMALEYIAPFVSGEANVIAMKMVKFSEIFESSAEKDDKYYNIKYAIITLDEKSSKEKKSMVSCLVQSSTTQDAENTFHERMKGSVVDYSVCNVKETAIYDIVHYVPKEGVEAKHDGE